MHRFISTIRIVIPAFAMILVAAGLGGGGCAGRPLQNIEPSENLASGVPSEILSKFVVEEMVVKAEPSALPSPLASPEARPSVVPVDVPVATKAGKKTKRRGKSAAVRSEPSPTPSPTPLPTPSASAAAPAVFESRRKPGHDPIRVGEKLVYDVTYLGIPAGELTIEARSFKRVNGRKVYHFFGRGVSSDLFSVFYKADDFMESFVDHEGLFSHRFHLKLDESKQKRDVVEVYDYEKMQGFYWSRWDHYKRGFLENKEVYPIGGLSQDSFSALFYPRFLDLPTGGQIVFPVQNEGKFWDLIGDVIRREKLDTVLGELDTIVIRPTTRFQGIIQQRSGDSFAWYTDDARRYLVRMEAKVRIGTVVIKLNHLDPGTAE